MRQTSTSRLNRLPKDVHLKIANMNDDASILNMLLADSNFADDEDYFMKLMQMRYPLLIQYKNEGESWKDLYVRMIHAISLLKEKYNFPYIPHPSFDPDEFIKTNNRYAIYMAGVKLAAEINDKNLVQQIASYGRNKQVQGVMFDKLLLKNALMGAARGGHISLVENLIKENPHLFLIVYRDEALLEAIDVQNMEMMDFLIGLGASLRGALLGADVDGRSPSDLKLVEDTINKYRASRPPILEKPIPELPHF